MFELEFGARGAEVRITRASRGGGVDAVAMDPDSIRGAKFVIQAKRYTNVVPVSAVRDLFGTNQRLGSAAPPRVRRTEAAGAAPRPS